MIGIRTVPRDTSISRQHQRSAYARSIYVSNAVSVNFAPIVLHGHIVLVIEASPVRKVGPKADRNPVSPERSLILLILYLNFNRTVEFLPQSPSKFLLDVTKLTKRLTCVQVTPSVGHWP